MFTLNFIMSEVAKISIVIPCYNRLALLKETISSVLAQDNDGWELILVDDGSSDVVIDYLEELANNNTSIRLIRRTKQPKGAPTCRNIGAREAKADYVIFLDSDDLISPNFIRRRIEIIHDFPKLDFIVFPTALFKKSIDDSTHLWNSLSKKKNDLERFFDDDTPWHTSGPVWNRSAFLKTGGFSENVLSGQDWELHVKALIHGLDYDKVEESENNINHFMRNDNHESITTGFLDKEKLLNRYTMYREILFQLSQNKLVLEKIKNNVIKYFYRSAAMGMQLGMKNEVRHHILELNKHHLCSLIFCNFLLLRLTLSQNTTVIKCIDIILFRKYRISNIDFPVDRTKGRIRYKESNESIHV